MSRAQVRKPADTANVRFIRFGDVFLDETTGWSHLCDATCDHKAADDAGELFMLCSLCVPCCKGRATGLQQTRLGHAAWRTLVALWYA